MAPLTSSASLFVRSFTRSFRFVPFRSVLSRVPSLARPFIMLIFSRRGFFGFLFERFIIIWSSPFVLLFRWLLASPPSFHPPVCPRLRLWTYWPTGPEGDRLRPFLFCFRVFSFLLNRLLHPPSHPSPSSHVTCFFFLMCDECYGFFCLLSFELVTVDWSSNSTNFCGPSFFWILPCLGLSSCRWPLSGFGGFVPLVPVIHSFLSYLNLKLLKLNRLSVSVYGK